METSSPMLSDSPESVTASEGAHVQIVRIGLGKDTISLIAVLLVVITGCAFIMGRNLAKQDQLDNDFRSAQIQAKLEERRLMDIEAYAMLNGWKIPGDDAHGPTGNLDRMKPKEK